MARKQEDFYKSDRIGKQTEEKNLEIKIKLEGTQGWINTLKDTEKETEENK